MHRVGIRVFKRWGSWNTTTDGTSKDLRGTGDGICEDNEDDSVEKFLKARKDTDGAKGFLRFCT
jgi:hypothetical protein